MDIDKRMCLKATILVFTAIVSMPGAVSIVNAEDLQLDFLIAAEEGDGERVQKLLTSGVDVNSQSSDSTTALMYASARGHVEIVNILLDSGAEVNQARPDGIAALSFASLEGHIKIVKKLIDHGAEIDQPHDTGATPLYLAAQRGQTQVVELLISKGANVNMRNVIGFTPLIVASGKGHLETVRLLLKNQAKNFITDSGLTALTLAIAEGRTDTAQLLMQNNEGALLDPMSTEAAAFAQRSLNDLGCDAGVVDGQPGGQTRRALRDFEEWVGLKPAGSITREVLASLSDRNSALTADPRNQKYATSGDVFNVCVSQSEEACRAKFETIDAYSACPLDMGALQRKLCVSSMACGKVRILKMDSKLVDGVQSYRCTPALWQITCT